MNTVDFGEYLLIEESLEIVARADFFHSLPVQYEHLKKKYQIVGRASKMSVLVGANMNPNLTIVLQLKPKPVKPTRPK